MKKKHKRLILFCISGCLLTLALFWILEAFKSSLIYYVKPSEILPLHTQKRIRVGGKVAVNSWDKINKTFIMQDHVKGILVIYQNPLPALFMENQEAVVEGIYDGRGLLAHKVFAKHDENYFPKSSVDKLKSIGQWRGPK